METPNDTVPAGAVERTMTLTAANLAALWLTPVMVILGALPFFAVQGWAGFVNGLGIFVDQPIWTLLLAVSFPVAIVIHEGLHALAWGAVAGYRNVRFGFKEMTPYTHCTVPMAAWAYRFGGALPGLLLGVIPCLVAAVTGSVWLLGFGVMMLIGAAGDAMILWMLRDLPRSTRVQDHPTKVGCLVYL